MSTYLGSDGKYHDFERNLMTMLGVIAKALNADIEPEGEIVPEIPEEPTEEPPEEPTEEPPEEDVETTD